ncbi:MAG: ferrochelatase [Magnetospirillum sp. WYHS-4]
MTMGGPDSPEAVQPFLFNLFNDPAIIAAPGPIRWLLAKFISTRRAPVARDIYKLLGGRSPILQETRDQAAALEAVLTETGPAKVVVAMRYWHPFADEAAREIAAFAPDRIVALPLYPQYSTTTSASSLKDFAEAARRAGIVAPIVEVCCYPTEPGFVAAEAEMIGAALTEAGTAGRIRLLFSAHGLPKKIVAKGDPYSWQVERSAEAIVARLGIADLDWRVCYQSRVGPLEWIGPATDDEIRQAGREGLSLVVVPIAFVSEHSETRVELDIEYGHLAREAGVPKYLRVPTVSSHPAFIRGLAAVTRSALAGGRERLCGRDTDHRCCPTEK